MHLFKLFLLPLSLLSSSLAADNFNFDVKSAALRVIEDNSMLPRYLYLLHQYDSFAEFCLLSELAPFGLEDANFKILVRKLVEKNEDGYIDALMQNRSTPGLEEYIEKEKFNINQVYRRLVRNGSDSEIVQMLMNAYEKGNLAAFKAMANEIVFDLSSDKSPAAKLMNQLVMDRANPFLEAVSTSALNLENFQLQVYIADLIESLENGLQNRENVVPVINAQPIVVQPAVPVMKAQPVAVQTAPKVIIHDQEADDCKLHSTLAPDAKLWVSGAIGNLDLNPLNGKDGIFVKATDNADVYYIAILEGVPNPVVPESQAHHTFHGWHQSLVDANGPLLTGMTMHINLNLRRCGLRRIGADKLSSSFVIFHEQGKDTDQLELYESMQKFYSGEVNDHMVQLCQHDTILIAPSKIMKSQGAQQGAHFLYGVFSGTFTPSKDDRMASFGEVRETLSMTAGPIDLYAIFLQ